ncbi:YheU family protein [Shewanella sp. VB17]|uniref:YheU family protein n=1 Tax=Shewanella sp. VB17 TaxID=2739432 RepID=UPI0015643545|nr:YheU family protein [Shewanella sp. VB17]NRD75347.1 YheU family protein [Shewanella sp. VB17]
MLIPYESLEQLTPDTFETLIKEYLFTQLEDGSFSDTDEDGLKIAITQCKQALKQGILIVEYSEDDDSIAIRQRENVAH